MLKKKERALIARELKVTKLSLPIRFRIARMLVSGKAIDLADALRFLDAKEERLLYCECCGPTDFKFTIEGKEVITRYGRLDRVAHTPIPPGGVLYVTKEMKAPGRV